MIRNATLGGILNAGALTTAACGAATPQSQGARPSASAATSQQPSQAPSSASADAAPPALTCAQADPHLAAIFADLKAQASTASGTGSLWNPSTNDNIAGGVWNNTVPGAYGNDLDNFETWASRVSDDMSSRLGADVLLLANDGSTMQHDWSSGADVGNDYTTFESDATIVASDCGTMLTTPQSKGFQ